MVFADYVSVNMQLVARFPVLRKQVGKMAVNYPIGDFLIRIKNAALAKQRYIEVPRTKLSLSVARLLAKEGLLEDVSAKSGLIKARLAYKNKEPRLLDLKLVSKPGLRIYKTVDELKKVKGASFLIISTSKGIFSSREAIKKNLGGEAIAEIW